MKQPGVYQSLDFQQGNRLADSTTTFTAPVSGLEEDVFEIDQQSFKIPVAFESDKIKRISLDEYIETSSIFRPKNSNLKMKIFIFVAAFIVVILVFVAIPKNEAGEIREEGDEVEEEEEEEELFSFGRRNSVKRLCGDNMDPEYAVNGIFFSACANGRALVCVQQDNEPTQGNLLEVDCDDISRKSICLCPDFALLTPVDPFITPEDLCGEPDAEIPEECSSFRKSIDFIENSILLNQEGLFAQVEEVCESSDSRYVQACIHPGLRLQCRKAGTEEAIEIKRCRTNACECEVNELIVGNIEENKNICDDDIDVAERCTSSTKTSS